MQNQCFNAQPLVLGTILLLLMKAQQAQKTKRKSLWLYQDNIGMIAKSVQLSEVASAKFTACTRRNWSKQALK
jgi:hypothetical protein